MLIAVIILPLSGLSFGFLSLIPVSAEQVLLQ
jgi:hypothetical protein